MVIRSFFLVYCHSTTRKRSLPPRASLLCPVATLAELFPGGNPGLDRTYVSIAPMSRAANGADDDAVDYKRDTTGDEEDLTPRACSARCGNAPDLS